MAHDVYQPCPYCTDRKLKFCCAEIAEEMDRVNRLNENGQPRAALKILDKLADSHPETIWNEATRASTLLSEGRASEAVPILDRLHAARPENVAVIALHAAASLAAHGFEASRESIWRAFRKAAAYSDIVSGIAMGVAAEMFDRGCHLSARQHLVMAMRFARPQDQQAIFVRLLEFDSNPDLLYPLRSVHSLKETKLTPEHEESYRKAVRLTERGCFGQAAQWLQTLVTEDTTDAVMRHNLALCLAWDGDESAAAEQFEKASQVEQDFEVAAEYAALAELLGSPSSETAAPRVSEFRIESASRLLTQLDEHARLVRLPLPSDAQQEAGLPDAVYELLDGPLPPAGTELTLENLPRVIADLAVFGRPADAGGSRAILTSLDASAHGTARDLLKEAAGELELVEERSAARDVDTPPEYATLQWNLAFPERTPVRLRRDLERARWDQAIREQWPTMTLSALQNHTPAQAKGDSTRRLKLAGALYVLDAVCLRSRHLLDLNGLRQEYDLPAIQTIPAAADLPLNSFSAIQLHRLEVTQLDDRQLAITANRAMLLHHPRLIGPVAEEVLKRGLTEFETSRLYSTLADLARDRGDIDTSRHWIAAGRDDARGEENAFEGVFRWDMKELALLLEDPQSGELAPLLQRLNTYYSPKLPRFNEYLEGVLRDYGVETPSAIGAGSAAGGLWTPGAAAQPAGGKLWIPGQ